MSDFTNRPTLMVTGHRPNKLFGYDDASAYNTLCQAIADIVTRHIAPVIDANRQGLTAISGGAQGADQTFFWAMDALMKQNVVVAENFVFAPFPAQHSRWSETGMFSKAQYRLMLAAATDVRYTNSDTDLTTRDVFAALLQRNKDMVDAADACLAIHLESEGDPFTTNVKGGTAHAMRQAKEKGIPLWTYDPTTANLTRVV